MTSGFDRHATMKRGETDRWKLGFSPAQLHQIATTSAPAQRRPAWRRHLGSALGAAAAVWALIIAAWCILQ